MVRIHQGASVTERLISQHHPPQAAQWFLMTWTTSGPLFKADFQPEVSCVVPFWVLTALLAKDTRKREVQDHRAITHLIDTWWYAVNYCRRPYAVDLGPEVW